LVRSPSWDRTARIKVEGASLVNGILHVDLVREVPEAMKPRKIAIAAAQPEVIEKKAA
jgi:molecular chaperone IbpA